MALDMCRGKVTNYNATTGAMDFQFHAVDILLFDKQVGSTAEV